MVRDDSSAAVPDVTARAQQTVYGARRYLMRHNDAFYGPMKDARCGCSECKLIRALLALVEQTRQERDEAYEQAAENWRSRNRVDAELGRTLARLDAAERERDAAQAALNAHHEVGPSPSDDAPCPACGAAGLAAADTPPESIR